MERVRRCETDNLINKRAEPGADFGLRHGNGHDQPGGLQGLNRLGGSAHGCSGRQTVVDQNDCAPTQLNRRTIAAVQAVATGYLLFLGGNYPIDHRIGKSGHRHHVIVEDLHAPRRNCTERQLFLPRHTEFANHEDIERRVQGIRNLRGDGDAAARQAEHQDVWTICVRDQSQSEGTARFHAVTIWQSDPGHPDIHSDATSVPLAASVSVATAGE